MATFTDNKSAILDFVAKKVLDTNGVSGTAGPQAAPFKNPLSQTTPFDTAIGNGLENLYYPLGIRKPSGSHPEVNLFNFFNNNAGNHAQGRIATIFGLTEIAYSDVSGADKGQIDSYYSFVHDTFVFTDMGVTAGDVLFLPEFQTFHIIRSVGGGAGKTLQFDSGELPGPYPTYRDALILKIVPTALYTVGDTAGTLGREQTFMFLDPRAKVFTGQADSEVLDQYRLRPLMPHRHDVKLTDIFGNLDEDAATRGFIVSNLTQTWDFQFVLYPDNGSGAPDLTKPITKSKPVIDSTVALSDQEMLIDYADGVIHFTVPPRAGDDVNPNSVTGTPLKLWCVFACVTGYTAVSDADYDNRAQHVARGVMDYPSITPGQGVDDYPSYMMMNQERRAWQMFSGTGFLDPGAGAAVQGFEVGELDPMAESRSGITYDADAKKWEIISKAGPNAEALPVFLKSGSSGSTLSNPGVGGSVGAADYAFELNQQNHSWRAHALAVGPNSVVNAMAHYGTQHKMVGSSANPGKPPVRIPSDLQGYWGGTLAKFTDDGWGKVLTSPWATWVVNSLIGKWVYFQYEDIGLGTWVFTFGMVVSNTVNTLTLDREIKFYGTTSCDGRFYFGDFAPYEDNSFIEVSQDPESLPYRSCCFDGRYVWFAPFHANYVLKLDTYGSNVIKVPFLAGTPAGSNEGFCSDIVFDGQVIWLIPYGYTAATVGLCVMDPATGAYQDLSSIYTSQAGACGGGVFDGRYIWFVPFNTNEIKKFDTQNRTVSLVATLDTGLALYWGGTFDGRYVWFAPYNATKICKVDTTTGFYELLAHGVSGTNLYTGCCFDGESVWFNPYTTTALLRVNATDNKISTYTVSNYQGTTELYLNQICFDGEAIIMQGGAPNAPFLIPVSNLNAATPSIVVYPGFNYPAFKDVGSGNQPGTVVNGCFDGHRLWTLLHNIYPGYIKLGVFSFQPPFSDQYVAADVLRGKGTKVQAGYSGSNIINRWDFTVENSIYGDRSVFVDPFNLSFGAKNSVGTYRLGYNPFKTAWSVANPSGRLARILVGDIISIGNGTSTDGTVSGNTQAVFIDAIAALQRDYNGGTILILPGTYTISSSVVVPSGVNLVGTNASQCILQVNAGATFTLNGLQTIEGVTFKVNTNGAGNAPVTINANDVTIHQCRFVNTNASAAGQFIYQSASISRLRIVDNYFESHLSSNLSMMMFYNGVYSVSDSIFSHNFALATNATCVFFGLYISGGNNSISHNKCSGVITVLVATKIDISYNICGPLYLGVIWTSAGLEGDTAPYTDLRISNNFITSTTGFCINFTGQYGTIQDRVLVSNNIIYCNGNVYGIGFLSAIDTGSYGPTVHNVTISNNYIYAADSSTGACGVYFTLSSQNLCISNNFIKMAINASATGRCLFPDIPETLWGSNYTTTISITGNHLYGGQYSIYLPAVHSATVKIGYQILNNVISQFASCGVFIQNISSGYNTGTNIVNNRIFANTKTTAAVYGIYVQSPMYYGSIKGNQVYDLSVSTTGSPVYGIDVENGFGYSILGNNIWNLSNTGSGIASDTICGIQLFDANIADSGSCVCQNVVYNVTNGSSNTAGTVYGLNLAIGSGGVISLNKVSCQSYRSVAHGLYVTTPGLAITDVAITGNVFKTISGGSLTGSAVGVNVALGSIVPVRLAIVGNICSGYAADNNAGAFGMLLTQGGSVSPNSTSICVGNVFSGLKYGGTGIVAGLGHGGVGVDMIFTSNRMTSLSPAPLSSYFSSGDIGTATAHFHSIS